DEAGHPEHRIADLDGRALATGVRTLLARPDRGRLLAGDLARAAASATTPLAAAALWADIESAVSDAPTPTLDPEVVIGSPEGPT
ncbi:MAG TPA: hypothetical protein VGO60_01680, partial [Iamia sp.]|nr:hypothetical protein [Iamia sp.]